MPRNCSMAKTVKSLYTESPIKGANIKEMNDQVIKDLIGMQETDVPDETEVIDGYESKEHFKEGIVPAGFTSTYGEEVTSANEGEMGAIIAVVNKVFDPADGFRFFFKFLDNYRFTIIVPIKQSNMDDLTYAYARVDARSVTLTPGNVRAQVEAHARRVAQNLKYRKTI